MRIIVVLMLSVAVCLGKPPKQTEVVIIGAGLSGLAAAYELKQAKVPFHILEVTPRVGGRVSTVHDPRQGKAELYADAGMEEYWESNPAVKSMAATYEIREDGNALMHWTQWPGTDKEVSGTDVWVIRNGKIVSQTVIVTPAKK